MAPSDSTTAKAVAPAARNVLNVVLGDMLFKTWYPSFYPEELVGRETERLYVCRWCFRYTKDTAEYVAHVRHCALDSDGAPVPGQLIYAAPPYAIYEVDGADAKLFAQNLSLFAKLFLDNKSVFFDVAGFRYYLLVHAAPAGRGGGRAHAVGFFSKEKMSWDNNNLACILVFPPWQRRGLGRVLMGASYELGRREGRIGGPEKPLSELGRRGYLRFWQARVARELLARRGKSSLTVAELAARCAMLPEDVVTALKDTGLCEVRGKGDGVGVSKSRVREWVARKGVDLTPPVDENAFLVDWSVEPD